ncbi:MAG: MFS transporter [Xanthobacteraceae bacterium]|nr:MFS transporter [Xanthobacteraceae bacterium]
MTDNVLVSNETSATDGLPPSQRRWASAVVFVAIGMAALDTAIANVALPAIAADLHATPADVVWVVNIYQIALVVALLPLAALGEIIGLERIYLGGLLLFTIASFGCAWADTLNGLLFARALQGLGGGAISAVNIALVSFIYPRNLVSRGFGYNAMVVGVSFTLGPTIASAILSFASWPWLFGINVPIGIGALLVGLKTLPKTSRAAHRFDISSALLAGSCTGLFIFGLSDAAHLGSPLSVALELAAAVGLGLILARKQADHPAPILAFDLFKRPMFSLSAGTAVAAFMTQGLAFVSLPFYFEEILNRSQVETGLLMTPWPLVVTIMAPIGGRLVERFPPAILGGCGLFILCAGMLLLTTIPESPSVWDIVWRMIVCGCGFGFFQTPNMKAIMSSAPIARAGGASGVLATARLVGQTLGAALAALCFSLAGHHGATYALGLGVAVALTGSLVGFSRLLVTPSSKTNG